MPHLLAVISFVALLAGNEAPAPPLESPTWLNGPALTSAETRGKVVLVEFWTFGCVNCVRTVPAMKKLDGRYAGKGLLVVGVHTPEFDREKDADNVRSAVQRLGIEYRVALDNEFCIWRSFGNRYWPALYLIDRDGRIVWTHVGELHEGTSAWEDALKRIDSALAAGVR